MTNNSKAQHELYCLSNPNRKKKVPSYGMLGKKGLGIAKNQWSIPDYQVKDSTRKKLAESTHRLSKHRWSDPANIEKLKKSMRKAVENNPEAYTSSNRGRTRQIIYDGVKFQGSWELKFYQWCKDAGILCERNIKGFDYEWNGTRTYYPDFYLPEYDVFVEVKGYKTDRDEAKWNQFPNKLILVQKPDIVAIDSKCYKLPS